MAIINSTSNIPTSLSARSYVASLLFSGSITLVKKVATIASVVIPFTVAISILTLSKHSFQIFRKSKKHLKYHRLADLRAPRLKQLKRGGKLGSISIRDHLARQHGEMIEKKQNFLPKLKGELNAVKQSDEDYFSYLKSLGIDKNQIELIQDVASQKELLAKIEEDKEGKVFDCLLVARTSHIETVEKLLKNPIRSLAYQKQVQEKFFTDFGLLKSAIRLLITTTTKVINIATFILLPIGVAVLPTGVLASLGFATIGASLALKLLAFGLLYHHKPHTAKEQLKLNFVKLKAAKWQRNIHKIFYRISKLKLNSAKRHLSKEATIKKWEKRKKHYQVELRRDGQKIKHLQNRVYQMGLKDFKRKLKIDSDKLDVVEKLPALISECEKEKSLSFHFKGFMKKECHLENYDTKHKIQKKLLAYFGGEAI